MNSKAAGNIVLPFLFTFKSTMRAILIFILLMGVLAHTEAQKVALVMSGGGAKGIAHVGVIKALEEYDIPIDYVIGTSMGAIVAGCYAAGYSAEQIERIMTNPQFLKWVNGEFERGYNYYFFRDDINSSFATVTLNLDSTFNASLNSSLAEDVTLNFALAEYLAMASAAASNNFDSLFVPARIIAAEIFTQKEVILKNTSLPLALRTSLSVPFFYRPIRIDDQYLFDGGVYNNFPIDVAQTEFNPDVIIGSNVASKIYSEYPENDDQLINNSLLFMLLDKSDPDRIPSTGAYIEPDLSQYTAFDFSRAQSMIDSGYQATIRQIEEIQGKIPARVTKELRKSKREKFLLKQQYGTFDAINFHGYNSRQRKYIRRMFQLDKKGELTWDEIKRGYFKLVSEKFFSSVYPDISYDKERGHYALELYGRPRNNFNVAVGGAIATRNISQIFLGAEFYYFDNYLLRNSIDFYAGTFYKSAHLRSRLFLTYPSLFYLEPEMMYNNRDFVGSDDIFLDDDVPTILTRTDRSYGLNIGIPMGSKLKMVGSGAYINNEDAYSNTPNITNQDTLDLFELNGLKATLSLGRNNFNRKQYPSEGASLEFSADYIKLDEVYTPGTTTNRLPNEGSHEWFKLHGKWEQYVRKGKWSTGYMLEGAYSTQSFLSNYTATLLNLPSFRPLQDSPTLFLQNFNAFSYGAFGLKNVLSIRHNLDFRLEGYLFKPFAVLRQEEERQRLVYENSQVYLAAMAGMVLHSPIGPISVSLNYYDDPESQWGVLFHVGYLLFNKNSLGM